MADQYWAALTGREFGSALSDKLEDADPLKSLSGGRASQIRRCFSYYYGIDAESGTHGTSQVLRGGEQGELAKVKINHSRALVNTLQNLITSAKLVWSPRCVNTDVDSIKQVRLAQQLLEYYFHEFGFLSLSNRALEQALGPGAGESFVLLEWDQAGGDDVLPDPDTNQMAKTGDAKLHLVPTWDVFRDENKKSWNDLDWVIVRRYVNKWDVAAQYAPVMPPDEFGMPTESDDHKSLREAILGQPTLTPVNGVYPAEKDSDEVEIFYFYHKRTPAVPQGKDALFLADGTLLSESPAKLDKWPLKRMAVGELYNTPFPYTPFLEILGIQELMDSLETSIASNQTAFGTQYIVAEKGSDIEPEDLSSGLRLIYTNPGSAPPAPLQLTKTAPEIFSHLEMLKGYQELIFGLNSVVRGEPQSGDQSGSALALLSSNAIQQASTIQTNYLKFVEEIGDCLFEMLRRFMSGPKKLAIVGKGNSFLVDETEVTPESFDRIQRVQVDVGNAMAQTASGRLQIAKDLMQLSQNRFTPEQYLEVLETGKLEPMTQSTSNQLLLIRSENEQIRGGMKPPALILDDHMLHVREHAAEAASPQARRDPRVMEALLGHIQEHEQLYFTAPPGLLIMSGQQPPPPGFGADGRPVPPPAPGPTPPGGESPPGGSQPVPPGIPGNPDAGAAPTEMPRLPTNPATGEQFQPGEAPGGSGVPQ